MSHIDLSGQSPRKIDAHDLRNYLHRFQTDNMHSSDVEHRWLAAYAGDLLTMAYHVKNGNRDTIRKQVNEFRLREIEMQSAKLLNDLDALHSEEVKLRLEIEQIALTGSQA